MQCFRVNRRRLSKDGKTVFDIKFISKDGNFVTSSGDTLRTGYPDSGFLTCLRAGYGALNFKHHLHTAYLRGFVANLSSDDKALTWQSPMNPVLNILSKFEPNSISWNWSKIITGELWESQGLDRESTEWSKITRNNVVNSQKEVKTKR